MDGLKEKIARLSAEYARESDLDVLRAADYAQADRILAIPEIKEALKLKAMLNDINAVGREHAGMARNLGHSISTNTIDDDAMLERRVEHDRP